MTSPDLRNFNDAIRASKENIKQLKEARRAIEQDILEYEGYVNVIHSKGADVVPYNEDSLKDAVVRMNESIMMFNIRITQEESNIKEQRRMAAHVQKQHKILQEAKKNTHYEITMPKKASRIVSPAELFNDPSLRN